MARIFLSITVVILLFASCEKTDQCTPVPWYVSAQNITDLNASIEFYMVELSTIVNVNAGDSIQFLSGKGCGLSSWRITFRSYTNDSAVVTFADGKRISFVIEEDNLPDSITKRYSPMYNYTYDSETRTYTYTIDDELYCLAK